MARYKAFHRRSNARRRRGQQRIRSSSFASLSIPSIVVSDLGPRRWNVRFADDSFRVARTNSSLSKAHDEIYCTHRTSRASSASVLNAHAMPQVHLCVCRSDMPSWLGRAPTDGASHSHVCRGTRSRHHVACIDANALRRTWIVLGHDARAQRLVSRNAPVVGARAGDHVPWTSKRTKCFFFSVFFYTTPSPREGRLLALTRGRCKSQKMGGHSHQWQATEKLFCCSSTETWCVEPLYKRETWTLALKPRRASAQTTISVSHDIGHDMKGHDKCQ